MKNLITILLTAITFITTACDNRSSGSSEQTESGIQQPSTTVETKAAVSRARGIFQGAFTTTEGGSRFLFNQVSDQGNVRIFRIAPNIQGLGMFLGKVNAGTRIDASDIGGTKENLIFEAQTGKIVVRVAGADESDQSELTLIRDESVSDEDGFFGKYWGEQAPGDRPGEQVSGGNGGQAR